MEPGCSNANFLSTEEVRLEGVQTAMGQLLEA